MARSRRSKKGGLLSILISSFLFLWIISTIIVVLFGKSSNTSSTTHEDIFATSAFIRLYAEGDRGKFIDICFNRKPKEWATSGSYQLKLDFTSYDKCGSENCKKTIEMTIYDSTEKIGSCIGYNVMLSKQKQYRSESSEEYRLKNDFIDNKLIHGNIQSLDVSIMKYGDNLISKKTFIGL